VQLGYHVEQDLYVEAHVDNFIIVYEGEKTIFGFDLEIFL
jgi:hypothetical protein